MVAVEVAVSTMTEPAAAVLAVSASPVVAPTCQRTTDQLRWAVVVEVQLAEVLAAVLDLAVKEVKEEKAQTWHLWEPVSGLLAGLVEKLLAWEVGHSGV